MTTEANKLAAEEMTSEMRRAMRDLLGAGFVQSYYEGAASEFVSLAEWYAEARAETVESEVRSLRGVVQAQQDELDQLRAAVGTAENMLDWRLDALIAARKAWSASVVRGVAAEDERAEWCEAHEVRVEEVLRQRERAEAAESGLAACRGVVQAARDLHRNTGLAGIAGDVCDECEQPWSSGAGSVPAGCPTIRALAAAADAPQPQPPTTEHDWKYSTTSTICGRCGIWYDAGRWVNCPGPSPAVLPETPETKDQR